MSRERSKRIVEVSEVSRERSQRIVAVSELSRERSQRIFEVSELSLRHFAPFQTIGVTIIRWNSEEISRAAIFLRKAPKSQEIRRNSFALLLHNTVEIKDY